MNSRIEKLLIQTSHNSASSALTMVSGLIAFPIPARIFSATGVGIINLVAGTLTVAVMFAKLGVR